MRIESSTGGFGNVVRALSIRNYRIYTLGNAISLIHSLSAGFGCGVVAGRTGVVLACYFVTKELNAKNAIARVRRLRPGSVETDAQAEAVAEFARRHASPGAT